MLVRKAGRAVASSTASRQRSAVVATAMGLCSLALVHCASSDNASSSAGGAGAPSRAGSNGGFVVAGSAGQSAQGGASQSGTAGSAAVSTAGASNGCMADADCGMGKICEAASCQAAQCAVDADCGATQSCAKQRCATPSCTPPAVPISLGSAPGALTVGLIGTFNSWSTGAASAAPWLLTQNGDKWSGSFTLSPGANSYKFFVESATICMPEVDAGTSGTCDPSETCLNGHCWSYVPDPANIHTASDGFGGLNAIITMSCTGIVPYTPPAGGEGGTGGASGGCAPPPIAFTYTDGQATTVSVYGSFDMWSVAAAKPLAKGAAGVWSTTINLAPDTYQYKFIVDTTKYLADPANSNSVSDGFGHTNSVLTVACSGVIAAGGSGGTAGSGAAAGSANGSAGHAGNGGAH